MIFFGRALSPCACGLPICKAFSGFLQSHADRLSSHDLTRGHCPTKGYL